MIPRHRLRARVEASALRSGRRRRVILTGGAWARPYRRYAQKAGSRRGCAVRAQQRTRGAGGRHAGFPPCGRDGARAPRGTPRHGPVIVNRRGRRAARRGDALAKLGFTSIDSTGRGARGGLKKIKEAGRRGRIIDRQGDAGAARPSQGGRGIDSVGPTTLAQTCLSMTRYGARSRHAGLPAAWTRPRSPFHTACSIADRHRYSVMCPAGTAETEAWKRPPPISTRRNSSDDGPRTDSRRDRGPASVSVQGRRAQAGRGQGRP